MVDASWRRCATVAALQGGTWSPPERLAGGALSDYREAHPLSACLRLCRDLLGHSARDTGSVFALADLRGTLLWVEGERAARTTLAGIGFREGVDWSEAAAGTNAPGTALVVGMPVQIVAGEHYAEEVRCWSCAAAPIRDPATGHVLGVVDLTGGDGIATPHALALVRATARAAEAELARRHALAGSGVGVRLFALGRTSALLELDGRTTRMGCRHSEIMVLLSLAGPGGLSAARLAVDLFPDDTGAATVRVAMSRLRDVVGCGLVGSQPYTLLRPVWSDVDVVRDLLAAGRVAEALRAYPGPLLPGSEAPAVVEHRSLLEQQVRGAVLASPDPAVLGRWVNASHGMDDLEAWEVLARRLAPGSSQRAAAALRMRALRSRERGDARRGSVPNACNARVTPGLLV